MKTFTNSAKCHGELRKGAVDLLSTRKQPEDEQGVMASSESSLCKGPVAPGREPRNRKTQREPGGPCVVSQP